MKPPEILARLPYAQGLQYQTIGLRRDGWKFEGTTQPGEWEAITGG